MIAQTWQEWIGHSGRKFVIFDGPHVADPCLVHPVIELFKDGTYVGYSDLNEIRKLLDQTQEYIDEVSRNSVSEEELNRRIQEGKQFGYVPNYPPPSESYDRNPFNLIEGNENKLY